MTAAKAACIASMPEKERGSKIIQWIRFGDRRLRRRHTWLNRFQDQIGLAITLWPVPLATFSPDRYAKRTACSELEVYISWWT